MLEPTAQDLLPTSTARATPPMTSPELRRSGFPIGCTEVPFYYGYRCEDALFRSVLPYLGVGKVVLVIDENVRGIADRLSAVLEHAGHELISTYFRASEDLKTLDEVQRLCNEAFAHGATRASVVISVGGGITENIAGMVAGLMFRGLPLLHLATTPVGAFDAVLSRKQAVNLSQTKNCLGLFLTPVYLGTDLQWLERIDPILQRTSLAEMAKNVLICLPAEQERFLEAVACLDVDPELSWTTLFGIGFEGKRELLRKDPNEKSDALVFEYGHTVGHAIETFGYPHAESIGWGMLVACDIALAMGIGDATLRPAHDRLLHPLGIRRSAPPPVDIDETMRRVARDNKRGYLPGCASDDYAFVLLDSVGNVHTGTPPLTRVPESVVCECLTAFLAGRS